MTTRNLTNFINGTQVDGSGPSADVVNPSTGEPFATAPVSSAADVDAAVGAAAAAFEGWRDATPSERSLALLRIADAIEAKADDLVAAEAENTGKPIGLTRSEEPTPMVAQNRFFACAPRRFERRSWGE